MSPDLSSPLPAHAAAIGTVPARRGATIATILAAVLLVLAAAVGAWWLFFRPAIEIVDVQARSIVVGNGKPTEVLLSYSARNADIKGVEVRFVRGDGQWTPSSWTVPFEGSTRAHGSAGAGMLSQRTATPMRATFEYTLVTRGGQHSAPLEKTFEIMPPAAITQAVVPRRVQVGQPFSVNLGYRRGGGDIVKVQRRVVDSDVPWDAPEQTTAVQLGQDSGQFEVPFDAPARPMRSTLEFTLVDALGIASEPVRVTVATAAAAPPPVALAGHGTVLSVVRIGGATGGGAAAGAAVGGALGNPIGKGNGRALATLGGVLGGAYVGHQLEQNASGATLWETTVQLDAGGVARVRHVDAPRWSAGTRVRVANGAVLL